MSRREAALLCQWLLLLAQFAQEALDGGYHALVEVGRALLETISLLS